jgi:hypothetical protein
MKRLPTIGKTAGAFLLAGVLSVAAAGARVGGSADVAYESLNSGGAAWASNGVVKLGGSLGQSGFVWVGTNGAREVQGGFWKLEGGCEMYPVAISQWSKATNQLAITFNIMRSNWYSVAYLNVEGGGLINGTHVWTNVLAGPITTAGGLGTVTTLYVNLSVVTNRGQFFVIRCEDP